MDLNDFNYDHLIAQAKRIDPINYLDMVHDLLLDGGTLKGLKYDYKSVNTTDFLLKNAGTCNTCIKCNEIKPASLFTIHRERYLGNVCSDCKRAYQNKWYKEKYSTDSEYRKKRLERNKVFRSTDEGKKYFDKVLKKYCEQHPDKIKEAKKKYYNALKNDPDRYAEYLRKNKIRCKIYNNKKKLEKESQ